jgi:uncharacterized protein YciI
VPWFVVEQRYVDQQRRTEVRPRHLEYLRGLAAEGRVVAAGPWVAGTGSLIVYDAPDEATARAMLAADPYTTGRVTELISLREWSPVIQRSPSV